MTTANRIDPSLGVALLLRCMCDAWGITPAQLKHADRSRDAAARRMVFWLIINARYPDLQYRYLAQLTGRSSHAGVIRGIRRAQNLLDVDDPIIMKYYNKVKQYHHAK